MWLIANRQGFLGRWYDLSFCKIASHTKVYFLSDTEIIVESEFLQFLCSQAFICLKRETSGTLWQSAYFTKNERLLDVLHASKVFGSKNKAFENSFGSPFVKGMFLLHLAEVVTWVQTPEGTERLFCQSRSFGTMWRCK